MTNDTDILVESVLATPGVRMTHNWGESTYTAAELARSPERWCGRPLLLSHPVNNASGEFEIVGNRSPVRWGHVGGILQSWYARGALRSLFLLHRRPFACLAPDVFQRFLDGRPIPISLGAIMSTEVFRLRKEVVIMQPDHVAVVPGGSACPEAAIYSTTARRITYPDRRTA